MRPRDGKNNSVTYFCVPPKYFACPPFATRQTSPQYPFPPIPATACHDLFLRWQQYLVFAAQAASVVQAVARQSL